MTIATASHSLVARKTVLIIDDNASIRRLVSLILDSAEFELLEADSGEMGIALACVAHPDVILLDIVMPGLDGIEVLRCLKSDPLTASSKIVMFTVKEDASIRWPGQALGVDDYLSKPFSPAQLINTIRKLAETQLPLAKSTA